jgi:5'-AMP-activated protein kinase, catalytic alpha subunit
MQPRYSRLPSLSDSRIDNYFLGKTLGIGSFGRVFEATHKQTGEKVAIKVIDKDQISDSASITRIVHEIQVLHLLSHPHIIQLYETVDSASKLFIVMEHASGGNLKEFLQRNGEISEAVACRLFQQLISAVEYIHEMGVAHRDITCCWTKAII